MVYLSQKKKIYEVLNQGTWALPTTSYAPSHYINEINFMVFGNSTLQCLWNGKNYFALKKIYSFLFQGYPIKNWSKFIWFKGHSFKFAYVAWKVIISCMKVKDALIIRGSVVDPSCCLCHEH